MRRHRKLLVVPVVLGLFLVAGVGTASADFVCPVFSGDSAPVEHNKNVSTEIGGTDWTLFPGNDGIGAGFGIHDVPDQATNDDGAGSPPGPHLAPGEPGYTPLWNTD